MEQSLHLVSDQQSTLICYSDQDLSNCTYSNIHCKIPYASLLLHCTYCIWFAFVHSVYLSYVVLLIFKSIHVVTVVLVLKTHPRVGWDTSCSLMFPEVIATYFRSSKSYTLLRWPCQAAQTLARLPATLPHRSPLPIQNQSGGPFHSLHARLWWLSSPNDVMNVPFKASTLCFDGHAFHPLLWCCSTVTILGTWARLHLPCGPPREQSALSVAVVLASASDVASWSCFYQQSSAKAAWQPLRCAFLVILPQHAEGALESHSCPRCGD